MSFWLQISIGLRFIKKCASEVHLKVFENLEKARKLDLLLYEFSAELRGEILLIFLEPF